MDEKVIHTMFEKFNMVKCWYNQEYVVRLFFSH